MNFQSLTAVINVQLIEDERLLISSVKETTHVNMNQELTQTSLVDLSMIDFTFNTGYTGKKVHLLGIENKEDRRDGSRGCGSTVIDFAAGKAKKLNINKFEKAHQAGISPFQYCFSILFILFGAFFAAPVNFSLIL